MKFTNIINLICLCKFGNIYNFFRRITYSEPWGTDNIKQYDEVFHHHKFPKLSFDAWLNAYGWKIEEDWDGTEYEANICNMNGNKL